MPSAFVHSLKSYLSFIQSGSGSGNRCYELSCIQSQPSADTDVAIGDYVSFYMALPATRSHATCLLPYPIQQAAVCNFDDFLIVSNLKCGK